MNRRQITTGSVIGTAILGLSLWLWYDLQRAAAPAGNKETGGAASTNAPPEAAGPGASSAASNTLSSATVRPVDGAYLAARWPEWLSVPVRDPFQMRSIAPPPVRRTNDPVSQLRLTGTWLQSGGRFAVINARVYGEGDEVAGFRVIRVDSERVILQGPESREEITFHSFAGAAAQGSTVARTNWVEGLMGRDKQTFHH